MTSRSIRYTIIIAGILMIGIITTQIYWVRRAFIQEEIDFQRNVNLALFEAAQNFYKITEQNSPSINPIINVSPTNFMVMINSEIDANLLEVLLKTSFSLHNLFINFEYSIYETSTTNKVFEKTVLASPEERLEPSSELPVFEDAPHYFEVNFPTKKYFVRDRMQVWMYSTIILLVIILFFIYALFVILKQKRLSDIQKDFINNMTHEFKTPISTIEIASDVLKDPSIKDRPDKLLKYATIIENENQRLKKQVDKVLQIASLNKSTIELKKESVDMNELIRKVVDQLKDSIGTENIRTSYQATKSILEADPVHITNIIYNLIDNAVKYSSDNPEIKIDTFNTGNEFTVTIKDSGIGISKEHQKHIFDKFYRVPTGNLHDVKGFGIGLHYVRIIVEAHRGTITLDSEKEKGSTFRIDLPLSIS